MFARKRQDDHPGAGAPRREEPEEAENLEFLEKAVWALDALRRHSEQQGCKPLAEAIDQACRAAREALRAAEPPPARIAAERMRALFRGERRP